MKILIVDDESNARDLLKNFLLELGKPIDHIFVASDIKSAVKVINNQVIDVVLLDIEMPQENGFALFEYFNKPIFKTIFCTAYSEYAIKAFEVSAIDYLLKPLSLKKLDLALQKVISQTNLIESTNLLKENLKSKTFQKIGIQLGNALVFIKINDIYYFEADGSYTIIHHKNGKDLAVKKLKYFEEVLGTSNGFFRIHRSYLINLSHLAKYTKSEGPTAVLSIQVSLPISRERKLEFEEYIDQNNLNFK